MIDFAKTSEIVNVSFLLSITYVFHHSCWSLSTPRLCPVEFPLQYHRVDNVKPIMPTDENPVLLPPQSGATTPKKRFHDSIVNAHSTQLCSNGSTSRQIGGLWTTESKEDAILSDVRLRGLLPLLLDRIGAIATLHGNAIIGSTVVVLGMSA